MGGFYWGMKMKTKQPIALTQEKMTDNPPVLKIYGQKYCDIHFQKMFQQILWKYFQIRKSGHYNYTGLDSKNWILLDETGRKIASGIQTH